MSNKYLRLILIALIPFITSCFWPNKRQPLPQYSISGNKWQQVKLRSYNLKYSGVIYDDTTYQRPAFDSLDFAQFNNNGTVIISSSSYHIFYPSGALGATPGEGASVSYGFSKVGTAYLIGTGTTLTRDTAYQTSTDTLRIHSAFDNDQFYYVTDAYYTRQKLL
jgi:hypothetical protein